MRITLHGAAGSEVTGSAYQVQTSQANLLVDFGLFQGGRKTVEKNRVPARLDLATLQAALLTHAHLDHCGRLPLLSRSGYTGPLWCTPATAEMTGLILRDSAKIQAQDAERLNRKRQRAGKEPQEPLYTLADVEALMGRVQSVPYGQPVPVAPGIEASFVEAGHMLGSASIQLAVREGSRRTTVVFSGDLGPKGAPILKDAEPFHKANAVFLESTYGGREHKPFNETALEFFEIVRNAVAHQGKILVPTFAVGRAQLMMILLAWAFRNRRVPTFPIYLDSPMAIEASKIYQHHPELFDEEMLDFMAGHPLNDDLAFVKTTVSAEESKALNDLPGPCLILAGAGMCNAGRILHHLRQNLWKPDTTVIIVGYQGDGTLGRQLVDGKKEVSIFGETVAVKADIHTLGGFSAHAGQKDLLGWFSAMANARPKVFLTHGEDAARQALATEIQNRFLLKSTLPSLGDTIEL